MKVTSDRTKNLKDSVFSVYTLMAQEHGAINLAQGFPDFDGPEWLKIIATDQIKMGLNQYAPAPGMVNLREKISNIYVQRDNVFFDPYSEITITNGATEGIYLTLASLLNPGDEVIVFEPCYDSYVACIHMAQAKIVPVTLHAPQFTFDKEELKKAFSAKTKLVILNSPHNPSGRILSEEEIKFVAQLCEEYDAYLLSDEVYEYLLFDQRVHFSVTKLPQVRERTIIVSSMGKTFGVTGWKIGWVLAPEKLTSGIRLIHQYNVFSVTTPLQAALALALDHLPTYIYQFKEHYTQLRDYFYNGLKQANFRPLLPEGTYFMLCPVPEGILNSEVFCHKLIKEYKVAALPCSAFYLHSQEGQRYIRFCFAKKMETLQTALLRLQGKK